MRPGIFPHVIVFLFVVFGGTAAHPEELHDLDDVLAEARRLRLHEDPYWHVLLHYRRGILGVASTVDDPAFFLAPDGKTNPLAELEATIRAFFEPAGDGRDSVSCRFVARYEWITYRLGLEASRMPCAPCTSFHDFVDRLDPTEVLLVFPMAHLNSPASMYGHTLLVIGARGTSPHLAHSVSYSALTQESFGPLFALKSIFGLYPGYYSVLPYYKKLQEYNDVDYRDIWEYRLDLTPAEIRKMLLHVRELESISSDYFFFDENCSFSLLYLVEAARPGVHLADRVHAWLIPLDSIRMIEQEGMINGVSYRPSRVTRIRSLCKALTPPERHRALSLARGDAGDAGVDTTDSAGIYELAGEYLQYLYSQGDVSQEDYRKRFLDILASRSELGPGEDQGAARIPVPVNPLEGHRSNRAGLGAGIHHEGTFLEMRLRPAYHNLMDRDDGYVPGAHLVFADISVRYFPDLNRCRLESLDVVDIISLSPWSACFRPVSWKITTGLTREADSEGRDRLVFQINPGAGFACGGMDSLLAYAFMETAVEFGGVLENDCVYGVGGSTGVLRTFEELSGWKVHAYARGVAFGPWDRHTSREAGLRQNLPLGRDTALMLDLVWKGSRGYSRNEAKITWNVFF